MAEGSKEYEEGRAAKAKGLPDSANIYEAGSQQSADWFSGYTENEREAAQTDSPVHGDASAPRTEAGEI